MNLATIKPELECMHFTAAIPIIERAVLKRFQTTKDVVYKKSRKSESRMPRQIIHFYAMLSDDAKLKTVGKMCGGMNHATVINSRKVINNGLEINKMGRVNDPIIYENINEINTYIFKMIKRHNGKNIICRKRQRAYHLRAVVRRVYHYSKIKHQ